MAALLSAALLLTGCGGQRAPQPKRSVSIGAVGYSEDDTYIGELLACLRQDVKDLSEKDRPVTLTTRFAGGAQRTEDRCVEELIDSGCDVLCVNLVDRTAPTKTIDLAIRHDIPVIFFNREPVREDLMRWERLYYVGSEARESGVMQGELAADWIRSHPETDRNGDGRIQYVLLEGEPGHQDAIIRTENSVDTLRQEGIEVDKLSYQIANWSRAQAQTRMTQMIDTYGSGIELVLANNDDMALGALDAYGRKSVATENRPVVFGTDGTKVGLKAIRDGEMAGTVYNDKEGQALGIARLACALAEGTSLDAFDFQEGRYLYLPYKKVTAENADSFPD